MPGSGTSMGCHGSIPNCRLAVIIGTTWSTGGNSIESIPMGVSCYLTRPRRLGHASAATANNSIAKVDGSGIA